MILSNEIKSRIDLVKEHHDDELYKSIARNIYGSEGVYRDNPSNQDFLSIGRKVFSRWEKTLYQFLCSPDSQDEDIKMGIKSAILSKDANSVGLIAQAIIGLFGISVALAVPISLLIKRLFLDSAADEVCQVWQSRLRGF